MGLLALKKFQRLDQVKGKHNRGTAGQRQSKFSQLPKSRHESKLMKGQTSGQESLLKILDQTETRMSRNKPRNLTVQHNWTTLFHTTWQNDSVVGWSAGIIHNQAWPTQHASTMSTTKRPFQTVFARRAFLTHNCAKMLLFDWFPQLDGIQIRPAVSGSTTVGIDFIFSIASILPRPATVPSPWKITRGGPWAARAIKHHDHFAKALPKLRHTLMTWGNSAKLTPALLNSSNTRYLASGSTTRGL